MNGEFSAWYKSLEIPGTTLSCCSEADCRPVGFRTTEGHYQAFIDRSHFRDGPDAWVTVPDDKIIRDKPNPTGLAQACWTRWGNVLCFILPSLT
jgi:hypothetical protein